MRVVALPPTPEFAARWAAEIASTRAMFAEAGVVLEEVVC